MTNTTMALLEYLRKVGVDPEGNFLHEGPSLLHNWRSSSLGDTQQEPIVVRNGSY